jgi:murein DD-endopeptidase MepM/ murein hydrolase activator NlpD
MKGKSPKTFTIVFFTNTTDKPKRIVLRGSLMFSSIFIVSIFVLLGTSVLVDYVQLLLEKNHAHWLRVENQYLKEQFKEVEFKLATLESNLERVDSFSKKLRLITNTESPDRELELSVPIRSAANEEQNKTADGRWPANIGPIEGFFKKTDYKASNDQDLSRSIKSDYSTISVRMDRVFTGTELKEKDVLELWKDLSEKNDLLLSTPSIRPTTGWISSNFGMRDSPFFGGDARQHKGLDIAAYAGTPIRSPASGIVSYAAMNEGYGNLISVDHGHGIVTRFGHCSQIYVKVGQRVRRGDVIGAVGSTGRSTGPHLHYEVRLNGVPINPERYILE